MPMLDYMEWMTSVTGGGNARDMHKFEFSMTGGATAATARDLDRASELANIHGDNEFTVRVQIPMDGSLGAAMVYDKQKSFQSVLDCRAIPGATHLHEIIRQAGPMGLKGYFATRREGRSLRIFYNILAPPSW